MEHLRGATNPAEGAAAYVELGISLFRNVPHATGEIDKLTTGH